VVIGTVDAPLDGRRSLGFGPVGTAYAMLSPIAVLAMELVGLNANRFASFFGGQVSLEEAG
jgi:hypothetical protein